MLTVSILQLKTAPTEQSEAETVRCMHRRLPSLVTFCLFSDMLATTYGLTNHRDQVWCALHACFTCFLVVFDANFAVYLLLGEDRHLRVSLPVEPGTVRSLQHLLKTDNLRITLQNIDEQDVLIYDGAGEFHPFAEDTKLFAAGVRETSHERPFIIKPAVYVVPLASLKNSNSTTAARSADKIHARCPLGKRTSAEVCEL